MLLHQVFGDLVAHVVGAVLQLDVRVVLEVEFDSIGNKRKVFRTRPKWAHGLGSSSIHALGKNNSAHMPHKKQKSLIVKCYLLALVEVVEEPLGSDHVEWVVGALHQVGVETAVHFSGLGKPFRRREVDLPQVRSDALFDAVAGLLTVTSYCSNWTGINLFKRHQLVYLDLEFFENYEKFRKPCPTT